MTMEEPLNGVYWRGKEGGAPGERRRLGFLARGTQFRVAAARSRREPIRIAQKLEMHGVLKVRVAAEPIKAKALEAVYPAAR